jgi:uncharacterized membrane protein
MSLNRLGAAAVVMVATWVMAPAAQAASEITFCNKTGSKVFIAIAYVDQASQKWTLSAWHNAPAGGCTKVGNFRTGLFYYYAEKEGRTLHWPAEANVDKTFCVPAGKVNRVMAGGTCAQGERNVGFRGLVPSEGKYTFNLS